MIALTIIGLIMAVAGPMVMQRLEKGRKETTKQTLRAVQAAIDQFNADTAHYPTELKDLITPPSNPEIAEKWDGEYLKSKKPPVDGWGKQLQYRLTPEDSEHEYELYSVGPKAKGASKGGKISVWNLE
jgi:general secretion pathway protein G